MRYSPTCPSSRPRRLRKPRSLPIRKLTFAAILLYGVFYCGHPWDWCLALNLGNEINITMNINSKLSSLPNLNILNPKALEKQLKILEGHIGDLQMQIDELEKMRSACLVLLGTVPTEPGVVKEEPVKNLESSPKKKKPSVSEELTPRILELLRQNESGMTADDLFDQLRSSGATIPGKRPVATVYSTLETHTDLFAQNDSGLWIESKNHNDESNLPPTSPEDANVSAESLN
jgi:hypothetical protein